MLFGLQSFSLITPAYAQAGGSASMGLMQFLPFVLIFVVIYFLLIRPQQKRAKEHQEMIQALRRGDRVLTGGGIIGTISKIENEQEVLVEVDENVKIRVVRSSISQVLAKTEPVNPSSTSGGEKNTSLKNKLKKEKR